MSDHEDRRHIAIVCDTVPYPTRSGDNQRIAELIQVLRREGWFVHFILVGFLARRAQRLLRDNVDALHIYVGKGWRNLTRNGLRRCVRLVDRVMKRVGLPPAEELVSRVIGRSVTPIVLDYWQRYPEGLDDFVARLATRVSLSAVIIEYVWLYPAARQLHNGVVRLLDTQDIQHKRVAEFATRGITFPLSITRDEEARIFNRFDAVIAIQAAEAAEIRAMCPQLTVLTAGTMGSTRSYRAASVISGRILYIGGFNGANIDGLRRFLTTAWPRIRQRSQHAHLHVCGYVYRGFLGEQYDHVVFRGHLAEVEFEYAEAVLVINPSWIGTGLKIKTVEALARGKPLVTTSKGIEGMDGDVERSVLLSDDPHEFGNSVIRLLQDDHLQESLAQAAKHYAIRYLNPAAVYGELLSFLGDTQREVAERPPESRNHR
jgi:glycosyltransferase involved in cell wall biosynthesis